jgi:hypothetical protein
MAPYQQWYGDKLPTGLNSRDDASGTQVLNPASVMKGYIMATLWDDLKSNGRVAASGIGIAAGLVRTILKAAPKGEITLKDAAATAEKGSIIKVLHEHHSDSFFKKISGDKISEFASEKLVEAWATKGADEDPLLSPSASPSATPSSPVLTQDEVNKQIKEAVAAALAAAQPAPAPAEEGFFTKIKKKLG